MYCFIVAEFIGAEMEDTSNSDVRETEVIRVLSRVLLFIITLLVTITLLIFNQWLYLTSEQAKPLIQKVLEQLESIETGGNNTFILLLLILSLIPLIVVLNNIF